MPPLLVMAIVSALPLAGRLVEMHRGGVWPRTADRRGVRRGLPPSRLDGVVEALRQRGYVPYLLLDAEERGGFQSRYRGHGSLARLDWPPVFSLKSPDVEVHVYGLPGSKARP